MARGAAEKRPQGDRLVSKNRRAYFDYEVGDSYEAGLALIGSEARSLRENAADLRDAWVDVAGSQAWIKGLRIPPMKHAAFGHEERRPRRLLLHAAEIEQLRAGVERDGMTVIATKLYFKNNRAKIEVALARGKKKHDKRQTLREREATREARQAIRRGRGRE
jgi:SsrA-binding protein